VPEVSTDRPAGGVEPCRPVPEVSVVVPHLNQPELLRLLLESLFAQDFDMGRAEVIVVDNGSRTLPEAVVADFPGVRLALEPTPGPGPARNRGVGLARGAILAFTDSDCRVDPAWLATILRHFAEEPGLDVLGGDIRLFPADPARPNAVEAYECVYAFPQTLYIFRKGYSVTANMATRRRVFDAVGPFGGIELSEDLDWGRRARALGHVTAWRPDVIVRHPARRTMDALREKADRIVSYDFRTDAVGLAGRAKWTLKAAALAVSPLAAIPRLARTDRLSGPRARLLALQGLAGMRLYRARRMIEALFSEEVRAGSNRWNRGEG